MDWTTLIEIMTRIIFAMSLFVVGTALIRRAWSGSHLAARWWIALGFFAVGILQFLSAWKLYLPVMELRIAVSSWRMVCATGALILAVRIESLLLAAESLDEAERRQDAFERELRGRNEPGD